MGFMFCDLHVSLKYPFVGDINSSDLYCSILFQSCSKRKRSAGARQLTGPDDKVFSTSKMIHILPGANSATTNLGIFTSIHFHIIRHL